MILERETAHALKNHLAIIIGFAEVLREECPDEDPRRPDIEEIHKAALAAVAIVSGDEGKRV
jgi:hypothetical protein